VTFSTDSKLGSITPSAATALTDSTGVAKVALNPASLTASGAGVITASVGSISGSVGYSVGAAVVAMSALTVKDPVSGAVVGTSGAPLAAFGTASITVSVTSGGVAVTTPQTVTFSSPCATSGKAVLTSSAATVNGIATASYRDNGCSGDDPITASVSGIVSTSASITVTAPTTGSIKYVSSTPTNITLRGMGGLGRQETAQVVFKVVDSGGNALGGKNVSFSLSTAVGGITFSNGLTTATATSDLTPGATLGQVVVTVNAGNVSTPVRVIASTTSAGTTLTTLSDELTITTGIPDQDSFSLSATTRNIEGWNFDGTTSTINVKLADHFNNPVPDGTAVNFTTSAGRVVGTCSTKSGDCTTTINSQEPRTSNGKLTVMAYAIGEESFTDLNGNGVADTGEMVDVNSATTDLPEAFLDKNWNAARDADEPFIDFNGDSAYTAADAKYNGVLCTTSAVCSTQKSLHVFKQLNMVFSGSNANIALSAASIALPGNGCNGAAQTLTITPSDVNGNAMAAGTTVNVTTSNGKFADGSKSITYTVGDNIGTPASYSVSVGPDGTVDTTTGACTDTTPSGVLSVTVTTPTYKVVSQKSISVTN
ncbi:MAG TPA: hypothetical protein VJ001_04815, partial [Rhodocyclaceae bacterium]|nr:hypothetical protein [Rhodocyclaceae bacterium]